MTFLIANSSVIRAGEFVWKNLIATVNIICERLIIDCNSWLIHLSVPVRNISSERCQFVYWSKNYFCKFDRRIFDCKIKFSVPNVRKFASRLERFWFAMTQELRGVQGAFEGDKRVSGSISWLEVLMISQREMKACLPLGIQMGSRQLNHQTNKFSSRF